MVSIGVHNDGCLTSPLKKLDNGLVVPDVPLSDIHQVHRDQVESKIELSVRADDLGYDYVLHPENHFRFIGSNSPAPLQIQSIVAARTDNIRLLQMANILPWHDPLQLAEQTSILDVLSNGRVDVGVGTGSCQRQAQTFSRHWNGEPATDKKIWEVFLERYEILLAAWTQDHVAYRGEFHDIPPDGIEWEYDQEYFYLANEVSECDPHDFMAVEDGTTVLESLSVFPKPVQRPHPQVWKPAGSARSAEWCARRGINACTFCTQFADVRDLIDAYYEAAAEAGWPDRRLEYDGDPFRHGWDERRRRGLAAQVPMFNTDVATEAAFERWKLGQECLLSFQKTILPPEKAKYVPLDADTRIEQTDAPIVGDSEEIIDQLATFKDVCGYEDFVVFPTIGAPGMTHQDKLDQLRIFAERVVPYFEE